jgi:hypothetical protein
MMVRQLGKGNHLGAAWRCGVACCVALTGGVAACSSERERLDALEHEVNQLREQLAKLKATSDPEPPSAPEPAEPRLPFKLSCPTPLRRYAALGNSLWTCRSSKPSPEGVYPQCNVVFQPQVAIEPRDYFEFALSATPQLTATQNFRSQPVQVNGAPSFEASFDVVPSSAPLKLLGRLMPQGEITYAVTCSAPASSYANYERAFRQIVDSFEWKH